MSSIFQNLAYKSFLTVFLATSSLFLAGCPKSESSNKPRPASSASPIAVPTTIPFDAQRAMDHVRRQVEFGPRPPGSAELEKARQYITEQLKASGLQVVTDEFNASTPIGERKMVNLTAEIPGESKDVIIISSHYDSKYYKDMHFVGANDPGSSVGTVLEIARVLAANKQKPKMTYWIVFFDGEEAFCANWDDCSRPGAPDNTYGSRRYVAQLKQNSTVGRVKAMILLDLMGYKHLELGRDPLSTRWLIETIWRTGRDLGYGKYFVDRPEGVGSDDHEPFLKAGIDAVDLIQLTGYPHWHKETDTIDQVSPESMKVVGETILASLPRIEQYLAGRRR